jgi:hypothetical protein
MVKVILWATYYEVDDTYVIGPSNANYPDTPLSFVVGMMVLAARRNT